MPDETGKTNEETSIKKLFRSRKDRMLVGVCGGIAEYLNVEPVLVRFAWVVMTLFAGIGILVYIAGAIIVPENPDQEYSEKELNKNKNDKALLWGSILVLLGIGLLLKQLGFFYYISFWHVPWQMIWAIFLIVIGIFLLYNRNPLTRVMQNARPAAGPEDEDGSPPEENHTRQFFRSTSNKMISGVCGGLAEYFAIDPTIIRLAWVLMTLASVGVGILAYIVMVIVFPEMPEQKSI
ncbi:MAG: PspC domain-containing protein [Calditrichaceae bacterium]